MIEGGHIIVTGAFGSLGRAVCDDLARRAHDHIRALLA